MHTHIHIGLDVGSGTAKAVALDDQGSICFSTYRPTRGRPLSMALEILQDLQKEFPLQRIAGLTCTGTGGKRIASLLGADFVNEIICHAKGVERFFPQARTVIDIGGEDAKLIVVRPAGEGRLAIRDFALNTVCAAGTGAFLEQQAARLGYDIHTFSRLAEQAANVPTIAGRCTVFAKSDMIHLQQNGVQDDEIIAGLCFAIVRNLKTNIAKGKEIVPPLVFQGGVAANLGVRRAILELLVKSPQELIVPEHYKVMGAVGAALQGMESAQNAGFPELNALKEALQRQTSDTRRLPPLVPLEPQRRDSSSEENHTWASDTTQALAVILGIDVGSVTTKMVLLDAQAAQSGQLVVVAKTYLSTSGRPLQAVATGLKELKGQIPANIHVQAVGSTGSGRALCSAYVGGDVIRNEISAQAAAATWLAPDVDTIFEIGGQDSKYIRLENGVIVDFAMNKVCAAGTGSFLEEQSHRLGISVQDFGDLSLSAPAPVKMGERCTVFMQSDLVHYQQQGVEKEDLAAGLCHAIVANYLNKVIEQRPIGRKVFFQGGTALNQGITAAFSQVLGREIIVPEHNEVTGAIGAAFLALRQHYGPSTFLGFDLSKRQAQTKYFVCSGCANACEVQKVSFQDMSRPLYFGHRCERYDQVHSSQEEKTLDVVHKRDKLLSVYADASKTSGSNSRRIGLPKCLFFQEWLPFFSTLFSNLGFEVITSDATTRRQISIGSERMASEACLPMKAAHGHVQDLISKGVHSIFLPQIRELPAWFGSAHTGTICPYVQSLPWVIRSAFSLQDKGINLISPVLRMGGGPSGDVRQWKELARGMDLSWREMRRALDAAWEAQQEFSTAVKEAGREVLDRVQAGERAVLLIGRPYNALDLGMNMNVSGKLRKLGMPTLPLDSLPLEEAEQAEELGHMYWAYGKRILAAGRLLAEYPGLIPVFVTNFSCGPDAFILHFFERQLGDRPYLELEIDEHTADAGVLTRLEAFLDSTVDTQRENTFQSPFVPVVKGFHPERVLYIPPMTDHLHAFVAAFRANGVEARLLPASDEESLRLGRKYTKGKECLPAVLTTGDILKAVQTEDFDPYRSAFFMPAAGGPCRFGLYHQLHRLILDQVGMGEVPVFSPNQGSTLYQELGMVSKDFTKLAWKGVVAVDLLIKLLLETRPYAQDPKECQGVYAKWLQVISRAVADNADLRPILRHAGDEFAALPRRQKGFKPVVGIVGEIYVRSNPFANEYLVQRLEDLGLEAWLPTIGEWIHYVNHTGKRHARRNHQFKVWLKLEVESLVQGRMERSLLQAGNGWLRSLPEPETRELLASASPYLSSEFEGEAVLSIGKSVDYLDKNVQGLINVMPFTCMPGGVVDAIMPRLRNKASIPMLSLAYDGQTETNIQNRLEAFAHQVRQGR
ncbi:MAG: acyl-CoA dehydratase activase [Desulfovermiculus sp.]|nr:acyl-CoA dehydratase activase [Desulfovermiculus sp.]